MDNDKLRKDFIQKHYSQFWLNAREEKYGFSNYDRNLISKIEFNINTSNIKLIEIAIGTGYPFADYFANKGYEVYGIDISSVLIEKCREINSKIIASVGDAENLEFSSNSFDVTYCFHSTWYFPNINNAILEMIRVTKKGGIIVFDIQNKLNKLHVNEIEKRFRRNKSNIYKLIHIFKQVILLLIGKISKISWRYIIYETPTNPLDIIKIFDKYNFCIYGRNYNQELNEVKIEQSKEFDRLVFLIFK